MNTIPGLHQPAAASHPQFGAKRKIKARRYTANHVAHDRRAMLRVKIGSLAKEAAVIRKQERKTNNLWLYVQLHEHRVRTVRQEARLSGLALAFIRGKKYRDVEPTCHVPINLHLVRRLAEIISKFGPHVLRNVETMKMMNIVCKWLQNDISPGDAVVEA